MDVHGAKLERALELARDTYDNLRYYSPLIIGLSTSSQTSFGTGL
jgi:hypothetical protein